MTYEQLKAHIGGLIRLNTPLRWISYNHWNDHHCDDSEGKIYALIDVESKSVSHRSKPEACGIYVGVEDGCFDYVVRLQLLIEGAQRSVWVLLRDVELIK